MNLRTRRRGVLLSAAATAVLGTAVFLTHEDTRDTLEASELSYSELPTTEWETPPPRSALKPRWNFFYDQRAYPFGEIPVGARMAAVAEAKFGPKNAGPAFTELGPVGFDSTIEPTWGRMSGRARALLVDPNSSSRLFLGTATGGVWASTDGGGSWRALTDQLDSLSIGALAWDPSDSSRNSFLVGTGEGPAGSYFSAGIFRTTDGGNSFSKLQGSNVFERTAISSMVVDPSNPNVILVCTITSRAARGSVFDQDAINRTGIWRSTNGGQSFTQVVSTHFCASLTPSPQDFSVQFASFTGVGDGSDGLYRSTDGGANWSQLTLSQGRAHKRLEVGISSDGNTLYVGGKDADDTTRIYKSVDGGTNYSEIAFDYCEGQCFYDNYIEVSPVDANLAYFGGVRLFRTTDGGGNFQEIGSVNGGPLHVDHHLGQFTANGSTFFDLNDGGAYVTDNPAAGTPAWRSIGGSIGSVQHYAIDIHPSDTNIIIAGNQDNGTTLRTNGNVWTEYCGGDGGYPAIDHSNPSIMYCGFNSGETEFLLQRSSNGGADGFPTSVGFDRGGDTALFIPPLHMDPNNSSTLFAGTQRVWKTTNGGNSWTPTSLSGGDGQVSEIAVARSDSNQVWAVTDKGRVERSTNGGASFSNRTTGALPPRFATSIAINASDPNTVFVGYSGFNLATPAGHVFRTTDGGGSWTNVSSGLPDIPVNALAINPANGNEIYAGTDVGLFVSTNAGGSWARSSSVPNVGVESIKFNAAGSFVAVGTHGRGTFTAQLEGGGGGGGGGDGGGDGGTPMGLCRTPNTAIPDNNASGLTDVLSVGDTGSITDLNVKIRANHTWVSDLTFTLTHVSSGTSVRLIDRPGIPASEDGCSNDNINVTLDDQASAPVESTCDNADPTIAGSKQPNEALAAFNGRSLNGDWRLNVVDGVEQDTGTLLEWCLEPTLDSGGGGGGGGDGGGDGGGGTGAGANRRVEPFLSVDPSLGCPGFYIGEVASLAGDGRWNMEVLLTAGRRLLQGGLNLGGGFEGANRPGFAAFNIANERNEQQAVDINLTVNKPAGMAYQFEIVRRDGSQATTIVSEQSTESAIQASVPLSPGFYVVQLFGVGGGIQASTFGLALETRFLDRPGGAFQGGVNLGGYMNTNAAFGNSGGFGALCIDEAQTVSFETTGGGADAVDNLRLRVLDAARNVVVETP